MSSPLCMITIASEKCGRYVYVSLLDLRQHWRIDQDNSLTSVSRTSIDWLIVHSPSRGAWKWTKDGVIRPEWESISIHSNHLHLSNSGLSVENRKYRYIVQQIQTSIHVQYQVQDSERTCTQLPSVDAKVNNYVFIRHENSARLIFHLHSVDNVNGEHSFIFSFSNYSVIVPEQNGMQCISRESVLSCSIRCSTTLTEPGSPFLMLSKCLSILINLTQYAEFSWRSISPFRKVFSEISFDTFSAFRRSTHWSWGSGCL